jgi:hypothetical protein
VNAGIALPFFGLVRSMPPITELRKHSRRMEQKKKDGYHCSPGKIEKELYPPTPFGKDRMLIVGGNDIIIELISPWPCRNTECS